MNRDDEEFLRFFAELVLSGTRFFAALRMTEGEGLNNDKGKPLNNLWGHGVSATIC